MCFSCATNTETDQRPNVILIIADDQGYGDLSARGNPYLHTPTLDELAESALSFENFYVSPVCSPTRAELLTGKYYPRSGVYSTSAGGERINLDQQLLGDYFKEGGYRTGFFGKWLVFFSAIDSGFYILAILGVLFSVISAFYYLKIIRVMFFENSDTPLVLDGNREIRFLINLSLFVSVLFFALFPIFDYMILNIKI